MCIGGDGRRVKCVGDNGVEEEQAKSIWESESGIGGLSICMLYRGSRTPSRARYYYQVQPMSSIVREERERGTNCGIFLNERAHARTCPIENGEATIRPAFGHPIISRVPCTKVYPSRGGRGRSFETKSHPHKSVTRRKQSKYHTCKSQEHDRRRFVVSSLLFLSVRFPPTSTDVCLYTTNHTHSIPFDYPSWPAVSSSSPSSSSSP
jgi:hypothetical protein